MILVTGVTGYIGGRLVPRLLDAGNAVRVMVRTAPERLAKRSWADEVEIVEGDVLQADSLVAVLEGVSVAYYLIHSMRSGDQFEDRDERAARDFGRIAAQQGVERIIYLSGLGDPDGDLSPHLRSRQRIGDVLRESGVAVTEFRAAVVVGSGSISFEMVRSLAERLPIMIHPRWTRNRIQPIAIRDVLAYLVATLEQPERHNQIIEIGGADVRTYGDMMTTYAKERGLRRLVIPVPLLTPRLSSYWVHWTTPISATYARPLIEGAKNETIVRDESASELFPHIKPVDYVTAVRAALNRIDEGEVETVWNDAFVSSKLDKSWTSFIEEQGMYIERRERTVNASPEAVFRAFTSLGGDVGWPDYQWLWKLRGLIDRAVGGPGLRRGRRHPTHLRVGDAVDFWRVEALKENRLLRLHAEMKVPGNAWLQYETVEGDAPNTAKLIQTAYFAPKGTFGFLYWWGVYPFHGPIFNQLADYVMVSAENKL